MKCWEGKKSLVIRINQWNQIAAIEDWVERFYLQRGSEVKNEFWQIMNDFIRLWLFVQFLWINFGECLSCRRGIFPFGWFVNICIMLMLDVHICQIFIFYRFSDGGLAGSRTHSDEHLKVWKNFGKFDKLLSGWKAPKKFEGMKRN